MVRKSNDRSIADGAERIRRRAETRRMEILRAAARVFRRQGFAATGMRDIAAEAELSPGNLYHYFEGKHEILFWCQERALERMHAALDEAREAPAPAAERLRAVIRAHVRCLLDDVAGSAAHLEVDALPAALRARIVAGRDRYEKGLRGIVDQGVAEGVFGKCHTGTVTRAMLGAINWTAQWYRPEGPQSPAAVGDEVAEYLVRGLERRTEAAPARETRPRRAGRKV